LVVAWLTITGLLWAWSGLSILVGTVAGDCETIALRAFGPFTGKHGGTCLAMGDRSSWNVGGGLAATIVILVGLGLLAAAIWVSERASARLSKA
jgi:hypothetical protein